MIGSQRSINQIVFDTALLTNRFTEHITDQITHEQFMTDALEELFSVTSCKIVYITLNEHCQNYIL